MKIAVWALLFTLVSSRNLPPEIQKCSKSSPELGRCLAEAIQFTIHNMRLGNKQLGLAPLEPFAIQKFQFGLDRSGSGIGLRQEYENVKIHHISEVVVPEADFGVNFTLDHTYWKFKSHNTHMQFEGDYRMAGRFLLFQIDGHGKCTFDLYDVENHYELKFEIIGKNNRKYLHLTDFLLKIQPKSGAFHLENLVDRNELLSREVLRTMNDNFDLVYSDFGKNFESVVAQAWKNAANGVLGKFSMDELFLP